MLQILAVISLAIGTHGGNAFTFEWTDGPHLYFGSTLGSGREIGSGTPSAVIGSNNEYLAMWSDGAQHAVRVTSDGEVIDAEPLTFGKYAVAASDGERFLVVSNQDTAITSQIAGEAPATISPAAAFDQIPLALAWSGEEYLLVYDLFFGPHDCKGCVPNFERRALLLDRNGRAIGASQLISTEFFYGYEPRAAVAGGDGLFAIATAHTLKASDLMIVNGDGSTVSDVMLDFDPTDALWDGAHFVVAGIIPPAAQTGIVAMFDRNGDAVGPRREFPTAGDVRLAGARGLTGYIAGDTWTLLPGPPRRRAIAH